MIVGSKEEELMIVSLCSRSILVGSAGAALWLFVDAVPSTGGSFVVLFSDGGGMPIGICSY